MITFDCMFLECGRKFNNEDLLEEHVKRRHPDYYKDRYSYKLKENSNSEKRQNNILNELENKIKEIENNTILLNEGDDGNEIKLNLPNLDDLELYNDENDFQKDDSEDNDDIITDEMLLIGGKYFQFEEVDEVKNILKERKILFNYQLIFFILIKKQDPFYYSIGLIKNYLFV